MVVLFAKGQSAVSEEFNQGGAVRLFPLLRFIQCQRLVKVANRTLLCFRVTSRMTVL